jgi:predicted dehydrogenase
MTDRRGFLLSSGVMAAGWLAADAATARRVARAEGEPASRVNVALIGCGGMGNADLGAFLKDPGVAIAALCDVDKAQLEATLSALESKHLPNAGRDPSEHPKPAVFGDHRSMLDKVKDIDAVVVATPDHWHALASIDALAAGKHVYCEKPLAHNIAEGRAMVAAAKRSGKVTQCGLQQRSGEHFKAAVKLVREGGIGGVTVARTWVHNNRAPDGIGNPADTDPPPTVDYDRWLGPAPKRAFNPNRFHKEFRWFGDYAGGLITDWGVHLNDIVLWAMNATAPKSVAGIGGRYLLKDNSDVPDTTMVLYDFGNFLLEFETRYCNQAGESVRRSHGIAFHGDKGNLTVDRGGYEVVPEGGKDNPRCEPAKAGGSEIHGPHVAEFLAAVRGGGGKCSVDMETAHRSTVLSHLGNISIRLGKRIWWDAEKEIITDSAGRPDAAANALLGREWRKGYELPKP